MNAIDAIRWSMQLTAGGTENIASTMRESPLVQPTSKGGNHTLWCLGHLAFVEGSFRQIVFGQPNPVEEWGALFAPGTTPTTDASDYPSFEEVLSTYLRLREENLKMLDELTDADLDKAPKFIPPGFEEVMQTVGTTLLLLSLHNMVHYG
ncbi:MAG: DinB family protein, partial [Planctomycetota bacterium]|nr:DinB family protein [Planctomycetota bacterium]